MVPIPASGPKPTATASDVLVVGAGIMGLWTAMACLDAGLSVRVIDKGGIAAGASGGVLGALAPYAPDGWNAKKSFQFEALASLEQACRRLEDASGMTTGYRQCGRLQPLASLAARERAERRTGDARANWQGRFDWEVLDRPGFAGWPPPHEAPFGVVWDTLTARVDPRRLTEVLGHIISQRSDIVLATPVAEIDPHTLSVLTLAGTRYTAGYVVIAAGAQTFPLLRPFAPGLRGHGVAGQAVLMVLSGREDLPVLYDDGIYVVPHEGGRVAVGSTVDRSAEGPVAYDPNRNDFLGRALALCPALQGAPILEGWAGLRPNCAKRRPLVGRLPDTPTIFVATGGYGISFGIGERVGAAIAEEIAGTDTLEVPESFRPASHLSSDQRLPDDVG